MTLGQSAVPESAIRPLKRTEYERLAELGAFQDEKVELLYGRIVRMSPQGNAHAFGVMQLNELLVTQLTRRARVRIQMPFAASDESLPEPDVAIVPPGDYLDGPPGQAHLVVEVAQSSLAINRGVKARLYALSRVTEYWIVDVAGGAIEVYREAGPAGYRRVTRHTRGEELHVPGFEDVVLRVQDVLPP